MKRGLCNIIRKINNFQFGSREKNQVLCSDKFGLELNASHVQRILTDMITSRLDLGQRLHFPYDLYLDTLTNPFRIDTPF